MKNFFILTLAISSLGAICLTGCDGAKSETKVDVTTDEKKGEDTKMDDEKKEGEEHSSLPADVKVASDNVVRNKDGKAYCTVMKEVVEGDENSMPSETVDGVKYIFCCKQCPGMFAKDPSKYTIAKK